jgi:glycosyltransferase involved in cell wall biosynthesis
MIANYMIKQPLRVALVTRNLTTGGAQRHIVKLCQTVPRTKVTLSIFLLIQDEPPELLQDLKPYDIPVFISPFRRHHPRVLRWLADGLRNNQIQVAHSFLWAADATASLTRALFSRVPLICSERGDRAYSLYTRNRNLYDRLITFQMADYLCAPSEFGGRVLIAKGCNPAKVEVIPNGVDLKRIDSFEPVNLRKMLDWPEDCQVVGLVSRLDWYKGVDTLIKAVADIESKQVLRCAIIGDGPQRAELERLVYSLGVADRIAFLGRRVPVEAFVKNFDIAVLTTRTETEHCSNSILEYMAYSRPVIATHTGGNPELVIPNETGLLVGPDDPIDLAHAIRHLLENPDLARQMGRQGRARIEQKFQMEMITARFMDLWHKTMAKRKFS